MARSNWFRNCLQFGVSEYVTLEPLVTHLQDFRDPFKPANCVLEPDKGVMPNRPQSWKSNGSTQLVVVLKDSVPANTELTVNFGQWYWSQYCNWEKLKTDAKKKECMDFYKIKQVPKKLEI